MHLVKGFMGKIVNLTVLNTATFLRQEFLPDYPMIHCSRYLLHLTIVCRVVIHSFSCRRERGNTHIYTYLRTL